MIFRHIKQSLQKQKEAISYITDPHEDASEAKIQPEGLRDSALSYLEAKSRNTDCRHSSCSLLNTFV